jgi:membrane protein implicated in regulation of membrane protease activity
MLAISILLYYKIFIAMRIDPLLGKEAMLGKIGIVIKDIAPEGKIMYMSEIWSAYAKGKKFRIGDKVVIKDFWKMQVLVQEIPEKSR